MKTKKLHPLADKILFGDIRGIPLSVLGKHAPNFKRYNIMDEEQAMRVDIAAFVQNWFDKNNK